MNPLYEPITLLPHSIEFETTREGPLYRFKVEGRCPPQVKAAMESGFRENRLCLVSTVEVDKIKAKMDALDKERAELGRILNALPFYPGK